MLKTITPIDNSIYVEREYASSDEIEKALSLAKKSFQQWRQTSLSERKKIVTLFVDNFLKNNSEIEDQLCRQMGRPISQCGGEMRGFEERARYMIEKSDQALENITSKKDSEFDNFISKDPLGTIFIIAPWNYPYNTSVNSVVPSLLAGNCVVLKPAPQTPLTAIRLAEIMQEAGLPDGVVNVVTGGDDTGAAISAHDGIDKVAFTGSTEVGKKIIQAAAGNLKKVTLELGGKSPNIIFPDADLDSAIPGAASAIFFNHGQCCCAGSRLYAGKKVFDQVLEGVSKAAESIKLGPGLDPNTEMGPLVSDEQFGKVKGYLESGKKEGATCTVGGEAQDGDGYFVRPTVFTGTKPSMKIIKEEIFGPVVAVESFEDDEIEKIIKEANNTNYGLAAGVWTSNLATAHSTAAKLRSGTVWINCYNITYSGNINQ